MTLLVNDIQATILADNEAHGKMHISLVYRGDAATAAKFLEAQEQVFELTLLEEEDQEFEQTLPEEVEQDA